MARIWNEGFESGLPQGGYLEGGDGNNGNTQFIKDLYMDRAPYGWILGPGRSTLSNYALSLKVYGLAFGLTKTLPSLNEFYFRLYYKPNDASGVGYFITIKDNSGNILCGIYHLSNTTSYELRVKIAGVLTAVGTVVIPSGMWSKIEIYLKLNSATGAYEFRIDDTTIISNSGLNTGSVGVVSLSILTGSSGPGFSIDDIALNDTTGSVNNSWCGSGTMVCLKPKGNGNSSQWDKSQGWIKAESGTTTTTLKITGHGLSTDDVIYNVTRNTYRIVTYVDVNTITVASITGQVADDIIVSFTYQSTVTAESGTNTDMVAIDNSNLESYDVMVNTTRSNAIRRVVMIIGKNHYNYTVMLLANYYGGSTVTGQTSGDSIKTFKVKQYPISNHYEAVNNASPNPNYSNIQSLTSGDIDTFDMQELISDLGLPSSAQVVAVSVNIYAKEAGVGSEIKPVLRSGGTDNEGSTITLSSGTLEYQTVYNVSPFTGNAWSRSEVDGLEAGVKLV